MLSLGLMSNLEKRKSMIINISSATSDFYIPKMGLYSCSKYFLKGFSRTLEKELNREKSNIEVFCLKPLVVNT